MAIKDLKFEQSDFTGKDISGLPDRPGDIGMTAEQLKARFDQIGEVMLAMGSFNDLIDALGAVADGDSGADNIGVTTITGVSGGTVQAVLEGLRDYADSIAANAGAVISVNGKAGAVTLSAADVDALPLTGGTLSGNLSLKNLQYPQVSLFTTTSESSGYITHSNNSTQLASKEENSEASNLRRLHIRNSAREANVSNAFWLEDVVDGTSSWHRIYGTHNKPTAAELGITPQSIGALHSVANYYGASSGVDIDTFTDAVAIVHASLSKNCPLAPENGFVLIIQLFYISAASHRPRVQIALPFESGISKGVYCVRTYDDSKAAWSGWGGALPLTGGTLTGTLNVETASSPRMNLRVAEDKYGSIYKNASAANDYGTIVTDVAGEQQTAMLVRSNVELKNRINLLIRDGDTTSWTHYKLYGDHNKPTAADVGAAPSGFGLGAAAKSISGTDLLDTLKLGQSGWYRGNSVANAPDSEWYYFNIISDSANFAVAVAYSYGGPVYRAVYENGALYAWRKLYDEANKPTAADIGALPLTGGTLTGNLVTANTDASNTAMVRNIVLSQTSVTAGSTSLASGNIRLQYE